MQHMLKMKEQNMQRLQLQVQTLQEETKKQHQQIQRLEVEKDGYNKEVMDTKHRCIEQARITLYPHHIPVHDSTIVYTCTQMEEVKRKEMELYQLKKKTAEHESKLKQQQVSK